MRQVQVDVGRERADRAARIAVEEGARAPLIIPVHDPDGARRSVVVVLLPNDRVGSFVQRLSAEVDGVRFVIPPRGVIALDEPISDLRERSSQVSHRSIFELTLDALQSIGSWKGMLLYAGFSGLIATYGVIFDAIYLLVAAMLIAPMGAPAMVAVIGTATGDLRMAGRGALRFAVAILVLIASAIVLGYAYGLEAPTETMDELTSLSGWIVLLAVVGGAAGAQSQVLSDRNSLVTATATGFLIAVALSPSSAVLGLSIVLGNIWSASAMAFVLVLTFVGIVAGGATLLRAYGARPGGSSPRPGSRRARALVGGAAMLATAGLVVWQALAAPSLRKADRSRAAAEIARAAVGDLDVDVLEVTARFAGMERGPRDVLVIRMTVAAPAGLAASRGLPPDSVLARTIAVRVGEQLPEVRPYVTVTVARGSARAGRSQGGR